MSNSIGFEKLSPDLIIDSVEAALDENLTGFTQAYPSYINRVYEVHTEDGERIIAKFYRPGRWSRAGLLEEHHFLYELDEAEIPVVAPFYLQDTTSLVSAEGIPFALFPKRSGRGFEAEDFNSYRRLGTLIGRVHLIGRQKPAEHRFRMKPSSVHEYLKNIIEEDLMPSGLGKTFQSLSDILVQRLTEAFHNVPLQRIHGDLHRANILDRMEQGLLLIDFDDMMMGPPVQDLWLLLPDYREFCKSEINALLEGYTSVCDFNYKTLDLIEPLRAMRMIYFLAWQVKQRQDKGFDKHFPDWGTNAFWNKEIIDLQEQLNRI
ncbi:serine/threonine protein kinase [Spirochaeta cellobiosiphila]|uniref:serine/threonine protein kinase n=1 Tax=Spirochaeta cellobiosiphila TaxID=504483 RepID=UPI00041CA308|nr:serine/threonine protein kinase [Spirochaeta cellobiosiphila]